MTILQNLNLQNIDLLFVGITIAAIAILGVVVFLNNRQSITHQTFFFFSLLTIAYGSFNYINYQVTEPRLVLWFLRLTIFFATWHAFSFFQLASVFPKEDYKFSKEHKFILLPLAVLTSLLTLTPLIFSHIVEITPGQVTNPARGPGIALFGFLIVFLVLGGLFLLAKKTINARGQEKNQLQVIGAGTTITFFCIIVFNFILPVIFNNLTLLPLAPVFFLPFIFLTAYAIIRYRFLNIKIIATEILTFVLAVVTLLEVLFAEDLRMLLFRIAIFTAVLGFGILLIQSVRKEVVQREKLQRLTDDVAQANVELKRLDRAKSEFVSIASHQLRTPLTTIKGYLSMALEGVYGKIQEKLRKPLRNVYESNERLIRLVNDLLSLSRIEAGKMKLELEKADVKEIISDIMAEFKVKADEKGIRLIFRKPEGEIPEFLVDKEKIRNVLLNVIDNAIRYTERGWVAVKLARAGNAVRVEVVDTGEGLTELEIAKLFESFSRGGAGRRVAVEGAGLGLYIARKFVEMHGGKIWAESAGKGKGSTFHVELPIR